MIIVPLPNAGGTMLIVHKGRTSPLKVELYDNYNLLTTSYSYGVTCSGHIRTSANADYLKIGMLKLYPVRFWYIHNVVHADNFLEKDGYAFMWEYKNTSSRDTVLIPIKVYDKQQFTAGSFWLPLAY